MPNTQPGMDELYVQAQGLTGDDTKRDPAQHLFPAAPIYVPSSTHSLRGHYALACVTVHLPCRVNTYDWTSIGEGR